MYSSFPEGSCPRRYCRTASISIETVWYDMRWDEYTAKVVVDVLPDLAKATSVSISLERFDIYYGTVVPQCLHG